MATAVVARVTVVVIATVAIAVVVIAKAAVVPVLAVPEVPEAHGRVVPVLAVPEALAVPVLEALEALEAHGRAVPVPAALAPLAVHRVAHVHRDRRRVPLSLRTARRKPVVQIRPPTISQRIPLRRLRPTNLARSIWNPRPSVA